MKSPQRPPAGGSDPSETIYGVHAARAVFARRRADIRKIAFERALRPELGELAAWAREQGVPCVEAASRELEQLAQSNQHEGLVLSVAPRRWLKPKELGLLLVEQSGVAVALDRVRNPQNIGAILRSAAFFGVDAALLGAPAPHPGLPPFALRVAEGGAEHLAFGRTTDLADTLGALRSRGVCVIGADSHAEAGIEDLQAKLPCVLVLGNEREGLGPRIRSSCDQCIEIRGSGAVESLNVAVAAGVLIAALRAALPKPGASPRQRRATGK